MIDRSKLPSGKLLVWLSYLGARNRASFEKEGTVLRAVLDHTVTSQMTIGFGIGGVPQIGVQPKMLEALLDGPWTAVSTENLGDSAYVILHAPIVAQPADQGQDPVGLQLWLSIAPVETQVIVEEALARAGRLDLVRIVVDHVGPQQFDDTPALSITKAAA